MQKTTIVEQNTRTVSKTLPEVFGVSHWNEDNILSYTVFTTKYVLPRDQVAQETRAAIAELESRCGTKDELHYVYRVEGGHIGYINANIRDPSITRPHTHILIGKHKITNSNQHPDRDWDWFHNQITSGFPKIWKFGMVDNKRYKKGMNGVLPHGALVYNLKATNNRNAVCWEDPVVISRRLRRHLRANQTSSGEVSSSPDTSTYFI